MAEEAAQYLLPDDWRDREDGLELVMQALLSAYKFHDTEALRDSLTIGHEFHALGLDFAATAVANAIGHYLVGTPLAELPARDLSSAVGLDLLTHRATSSTPEDPLLGQFLGLTADVTRGGGNLALALDTYLAAASMLERLDMPSEAASLYQSAGATAVYLNDFAAAVRWTERARDIFDLQEDRRGSIEVRLNLVDTAIAADRVDDAAALLEEIENEVRRLRDGHLTASWHSKLGVVEGKRGNLKPARKHMLLALRSCRQRGDSSLEIVVLQNLTKVLRDVSGSTTSLPWAIKALRVAQELGDRDRVQILARGLAADLMDAGRYEEASEVLREAEAINVDLGQELEAARTRADLGAAYLANAFAAGAQLDEGQTDERLVQAEQVLLDALAQLDGFRDYDWALRVLHNLQIAWRSPDQAARGGLLIERYVESAKNADPTYFAGLLRASALLGLAGSSELPEAMNKLELAAAAGTTDPATRGWRLAEDAALVEHSLANHEAALALYDSALRLLSEADHPSGFADILNDSALVAAAMDRPEDAKERLVRVLEHADDSHNRVLGALARANLGELALQEDDVASGVDHLRVAADLAEQVGDLSRASDAWASISGALLRNPGPLADARKAARRAEALASQADTNNAVARAVSAEASVEFADGAFMHAYDLWLKANSLKRPNGSGTYLAFALDALAREGNWSRFSRVLDSLTRKAQRQGVQLEFAEQLPLSAMSWLRAGSARRSSKALAYALALATEGYTKRERDPLSEDKIALDQFALVSTMKTFFTVHSIVTNKDYDERTLLSLRKHLEQHTARVVGEENSSILLEQVDHVARLLAEDSD